MSLNFSSKTIRLIAMVMCYLMVFLNAMAVCATGASGGGGSFNSAGQAEVIQSGNSYDISKNSNSNVPWITGYYGEIVIPTSSAYSELSVDKRACRPGESVVASIYVKSVANDVYTNSNTTTFSFDNTAFEYETGMLATSVYFPQSFNVQKESVTGNITTITYGYYDTQGKSVIKAGDREWMTVRLKAKSNPWEGYYYKLGAKVNIYDLQSNPVIGSGEQFMTRKVMVSKTIATLNGCISVYLGEGHPGLNKLIRSNLSQSEVNIMLKKLTMFLIPNSGYIGGPIEFEEWIKRSANGQLFHYSSDGRVIVNFSLPVSSKEFRALQITGDTYVTNGDYELPVYELDGDINVNTEQNPIVIYPGDIAAYDLYSKKIYPGRDKQLESADFSLWYYNYITDFNGSRTDLRLWNLREADFTKDGKVDNVDFSLWLAVTKILK